MKIAYFGRIVKVGNSYCVTVPKEIRIIIEAKHHDMLRIEVEKVPLYDNLHDDDAARQNPETRDKGIHQKE